jgi:dTDP-4-amino-4,6-dideoxy-D-galactose acyltransferase
MEANSVVEYLEWDSNFFGMKIARILPNRLARKDLELIKDFCAGQSVDCLYFLADPGDEETIQLAEKDRFHLVDIRVTLEKYIDRSPVFPGDTSDSSIRTATEEDIPNLISLVKNIHFDTRFYFDPSFPNALCDRLYETWIENSVRSEEQVVFLCETEQKQAVGFITCNVGENRLGQIGLIGIDREYQGKGFGKRLLGKAIRWFYEQDINHISVVTQGRNIKSQNLYQKAGFLTKSVYLWYHKWF